MFPGGMYLIAGSQQPQLEYLHFTTGRVRRVAPLPPSAHLEADVSPNERWTLFAEPGLSDRNLIVAENFR